MSSFALTAVAGIPSALMDRAFTVTASQTGETTVQFGDGLHGAAPPLGHCSTPPANYAAGGGASGNAADAAPQPREDRPLLRSGYGEVEFGAVGRHFSGMLMQQGRVQTDADYNEAAAVDKPSTSGGAVDVERPDLASVSSRLDSMSEMGETESLRLQMAMDRLSKLMNTLSNLLHRVEATNAAITQNMK